MLRLLQLNHPHHGRRVALVQEDALILLTRHRSIHELALAAIDSRKSLAQFVPPLRSRRALDYGPIHAGDSDWRLLPAFDHPAEPARCLVTGTGLTHKASVATRQAMHSGAKKKPVLSDSARMYQWGLEGGRPARGKIGVAPEWFYKGCGTC